MSKEYSHAERALLFTYAMNKGEAPENFGSGREGEIRLFAAVSGLTRQEATAAFSECVKHGWVGCPDQDN